MFVIARNKAIYFQYFFFQHFSFHSVLANVSALRWMSVVIFEMESKISVLFGFVLGHDSVDKIDIRILCYLCGLVAIKLPVLMNSDEMLFYCSNRKKPTTKSWFASYGQHDIKSLVLKLTKKQTWMALYFVTINWFKLMLCSNKNDLKHYDHMK